MAPVAIPPGRFVLHHHLKDAEDDDEDVAAGRSALHGSEVADCSAFFSVTSVSGILLLSVSFDIGLTGGMLMPLLLGMSAFCFFVGGSRGSLGFRLSTFCLSVPGTLEAEAGSAPDAPPALH